MMKKIFVILLCSITCYSFLAYAGENKKAFVDLNASALIPVSLSGDIGLGYKYELDSNKKYWGYVLANANIGGGYSFSFFGIKEYDLYGKFNIEYGYEFMRQSLFSFGLNISPLIAYYWNDVFLSHSIGIFGNFNINNSFKIGMEVKAVFSTLDHYLRTEDKENHAYGLFFPLTLLEIKARYYFW